MSFSLPHYTEEEVIGALKSYQKDLVVKLLSDNDEIASAKIWLTSSGPLDLGKFGGVPSPGSNNFFDRFIEEFRGFVCGDGKYIKDREEFSKVAKPLATYTINAISVAIASTLGVASGLLFPAVALLLKVVAKTGLNAWCACGDVAVDEKS